MYPKPMLFVHTLYVKVSTHIELPARHRITVGTHSPACMPVHRRVPWNFVSRMPYSLLGEGICVLRHTWRACWSMFLLSIHQCSRVSCSFRHAISMSNLCICFHNPTSSAIIKVLSLRVAGLRVKFCCLVHRMWSLSESSHRILLLWRLNVHHHES
jgi:hypothetical protein